MDAPERRQHLRMRRQRHSRRRVRLPRHRPRQNLYLHVMEQPVGPLALTGLSPAAIRSARVLATGAEADILTSGWAVQNYPQTAFLSLAAQANETLPCRMKRIPSSI